MSQTPTTVKGMLAMPYFAEQVAKALPDICTSERFMRIALTALIKTPKLNECTFESIQKCMLDCASLGIEPDGRRAHLIPYNKNTKMPDGSWRKVPECQLIIDYKGLIELVMRSGEVVNIYAAAVHENDDFVFNMGRIEKHVPYFRGDRGAVYGYYAFAEKKCGAMHADFMTVDQIEAIRKRSKSGTNGPWITDFEEMAKKTVFRRISKWLPMAVDAIPRLDEIEAREFQKQERDITPERPRIAPASPNMLPLPSQQEPEIVDPAGPLTLEDKQQ